MYLCFNCHKEVDVEQRVGFRDECPYCNSPLHVCMNCSFYAPGAYNDCKESSAERVLTKDRENRCEYFNFKNSRPGTAPDKSKAYKLADQLFKK